MDDVEILAEPEWAEALLADVDRAFALTGAGTPGWPAPHPDRDPLDEEYSRCLDAGKYRILPARIEAWAQVLGRSGVADAVDPGDPVDPVDVAPAGWVAAIRPPEDHGRVRRIVPRRPGGLALAAATTLVDGEAFGIDVGVARVGEPPAFLATVPQCGCDACDDGSDELLEELDGWFLTLAIGGVVLAIRGAERCQRRYGGTSCSGRGQWSWLDATSVVPDDVERWIGEPWLS